MYTMYKRENVAVLWSRQKESLAVHTEMIGELSSNLVNLKPAVATSSCITNACSLAHMHIHNVWICLVFWVKIWYSSKV